MDILVSHLNKRHLTTDLVKIKAYFLFIFNFIQCHILALSFCYTPGMKLVNITDKCVYLSNGLASYLRYKMYLSDIFKYFFYATGVGSQYYIARIIVSPARCAGTSLYLP